MLVRLSTVLECRGDVRLLAGARGSFGGAPCRGAIDCRATYVQNRKTATGRHLVCRSIVAHDHTPRSAMSLFDDITDLTLNAARIGARRHGMIEVAAGRLVRVRLRPWARRASLLEM